MYKNIDTNIKNINYYKFIKYKYKYLKLKNNISQFGGSHTKNIDSEIKKFMFFIYNLLDDNLTVYLKGGSVLGLKVLQILIQKEGLSEKTLDDFLSLKLIKDWDFAAFTYKPTIKTYANEAKKYQLVNRAKTFILYQSKFPVRINEEKSSEVLYEISIKENETFSNLELPLTTMQIKINKHNIKNIFHLSKIFYLSKPINIKLLSDLLNNLSIDIYPCINGLFNISSLEYNNLSNDVLNLIKSTTNIISEQQFLITQIIEPHRLFHRFINKNIPKSNNIKKFLIHHNLYNNTDYCWLLHSDQLMALINKFIDGFSILLKNTNVNYLSTILKGINLNRIIIEFNKFNPVSILLLKKIFIHIYPYVLYNINNLKDPDIYNFFKFISKKNIF